MDSLARNVLRLSLAGAGAAVLGAGFVGQASAAELPEAPSAPEAPDTSLLTDNLPPTADNNVTMNSDDPDSASSALPGADPLPSADSAPDAGSVPSLNDLPPLEIPGAMHIAAPTGS